MTTTTRTPPARRVGAAPKRTARLARGALVAWTALLALVLTGLHRAGEVLPAPPDPSRPGDTLRWLDLHGALTAVFVLLRAVGLLVAAYLLVVTLLGVLARVSRREALVRVTDAVTVARLRRFLRATAAVGALSAPVLAAAAPSSAWATDAPPPTIRVLPPDPVAAPTVTTTAPGRLPGIDPPVLRRLPAPVPTETTTQPPATTNSPPASPTPPAPPTTPPPADPPPPPATTIPPPSEDEVAPPSADGRPVAPPPRTPEAPDGHRDPAAHESGSAGLAPEGTWRIEPGDHLWRVAEQTLVARIGRPPTEDQISAYLARIIEANRSVLVVPDNPDLVFAGQVFLLPPVS